MRSHGRRACHSPLIGLTLLLAAAGSAASQAACPDPIPLRVALDRLAEETGTRFSFSSDVLPVNRQVCPVGAEMTVSEALAALLKGTGVEPRTVGRSHVALVPVQTGLLAVGAAGTEPEHAIALDAVRVGASRIPGSAPAPAATTVITGDALRARPAASLLTLLSDAVPGMWAWPPGGPFGSAGFGGLRGAASFVDDRPKVYLDGIELANPASLAGLSAETIDYIEVIPGPQGAARYGANAAGGVIIVHTRHGPAPAGDGQVRVRAQVGLDRDRLAPSLAREQGVGVDVGGERAWARVDVARAPGDGTAGAGSGHTTAEVAGRLVGERSLVSVSGRYRSDESAPGPVPASWPSSVRPPASSAVREITAGLSAALEPGERWVHRVVVGMDAREIESSAGSATESGARHLALASAERLTMRVASTGRFDIRPAWRGLVTLGADRSILREHAALGEASAAPGVARAALGGLSPVAGGASWPSDGGTRQTWTRSNTGVSAHASLLVGERLSLDGGLRYDRLGGAGGPGLWVSQPSMGAAWSTAVGPLDVTVRGAYGRAIRWREPAIPEGVIAPPTALPVVPWVEQQAGVEAGLDLRLEDWIDVRVTRFDQTASGLSQPASTMVGAQPAALASPAGASVGPPAAWNVGEIGNGGWEAQGTLRAATLSVTGTLATVDSRVLRTTAGYEGELRPGDRMLGVPARITGLTASRAAPRWSGLLTVSRASDWVGYDHAALEDLAATGAPPPRGPALRAFWRDHDGITRVGASARYGLLLGLDLTLGVENLLDAGGDDPHGFMIVAPRAVTLGMRLSF